MEQGMRGFAPKAHRPCGPVDRKSQTLNVNWCECIRHYLRCHFSDEIRKLCCKPFVFKLLALDRVRRFPLIIYWIGRKCPGISRSSTEMPLTDRPCTIPGSGSGTLVVRINQLKIRAPYQASTVFSACLMKKFRPK